MHNLAKTILGDIPYVIAGGYPRDLHFGITPKDCDVFVNYRHRAKVIKAIADNIICYTEYPSYDKTRNTKHMAGVIKLLAGNIDIILVYDDIDIRDVTKYFDFNINQWRLLGDLPEYEGNYPFYQLRQLHEDVPTDRILKIFKKHQELIKNGKV
jgi:hypothetical protein